MAKERQPENPVEALIRKWAHESKNGAMLPDFDPEFSASFPHLFSLLTWKEASGMLKAPGSITIQADGSAWKLTYRDPSSQRWTAVVAQTVMEGLRKLNEAIPHPDTVWNGGKRPQRDFREKKK